MINKYSFFSVLSLAASLAACSSQGNRLSGQQCPRRLDPIAMNVPSQSKLELKPEALPVGEYALRTSQFYFKGDPTPTNAEGFRVLLHDESAKGGEVGLHTVTDCVRNAKVTQAYGASVQGLSGLKVEAGGKVTPQVREYGFTMSETGEYKVTDEPGVQKVSMPQDLYAGAGETFVVKHGPNDFEIRVKGPGLNGTYFLSTFLRKVK